MAKKAHFAQLLNWVTTDPAPFVPNTAASGVLAGAMASTNIVYTQIVDLTLYDDIGLELTWSGTPTGTIVLLGSVSGATFYSLPTPAFYLPALVQPAGSASGEIINLSQFPLRYFYIKYTNASGSGSLTAWISAKDLN